jgi:drug/metabolite transporter (DMT)-like permease
MIPFTMHESMFNYALYFFALFSLSQSANLIKWSALPPEVIGFWRLLGGSILIFSYVAVREGFGPIFATLKQRKLLILTTGFLFFVHLWSYSFSAQNTKIANCMIIFSINPLFTAIGAYFLFRERPTKYIVLAYVLALAGLYLLVSQTMKFSPEGLAGEFASFASAILFSAYLLACKKARSNTNNWHFVIWVYFTSSLLFGIASYFNHLNPFALDVKGGTGIVAIIILPTILGHAVFTYLMEHLDINLMSCGKLLEPLMSALVAFVVFREALPWTTQVSFLLTSAAMALLFFPKLLNHHRKKKSPHSP